MIIHFFVYFKAKDEDLDKIWINCTCFKAHFKKKKKTDKIECIISNHAQVKNVGIW